MNQCLLTNQIPRFEFSNKIITVCKITAEIKSDKRMKISAFNQAAAFGFFVPLRWRGREVLCVSLPHARVSSRFPAMAKTHLCSSQFSLISYEAWMVSIPPSSSLSSLPYFFFFRQRSFFCSSQAWIHLCPYACTLWTRLGFFLHDGGIKTNMFSKASVAKLCVTLRSPQNYQLPSCQKR